MRNTIDYEALGMQIKKFRQKKHLTQEQLADLIDAATSTIAHAESGSSKPSLPLLISIASTLDVTIDQLLCNDLPVVEAYLDKDIAELFSDCTLREKQILKDIIILSKQTIRKHS